MRTGLGYAIHCHPACHQGRYERGADNFAANLLIDLHENAEAERIYDGAESSIAQKLNVILSLLQHWTSLYERATA